MPMIDMPVTPVAGAEVVIERRVGEAGNRGLSPVYPPPVSDANSERAVGFCMTVQQTAKNWNENDWREKITVGPNAVAQSYYKLYENRQVSLPPFDSVLIVKQPKHGTLTRQKNAVRREVYVYEPAPGYLGKDQFEVLVPVGGETVRVLYFVHVQTLPTENDVFDSRRYCPKSEWKISTDLNSTGGRSNWGLTSIDLPPNDSAVGLSDLPFRRSVS